jgi:hypothetical protein
VGDVLNCKGVAKEALLGKSATADSEQPAVAREPRGGSRNYFVSIKSLNSFLNFSTFGRMMAWQ